MPMFVYRCRSCFYREEASSCVLVRFCLSGSVERRYEQQSMHKHADVQRADSLTDWHTARILYVQ